MRRKRLGQALLLIFLVPVLAINIFCAFRVHHLSDQRATLKNDYSYVNDIRYGLLSVNAWRTHLQFIVNDKIQDFSVTPEQEAVLREQISNVLNELITKADSMIQHSDHSLNGKIRKIAVNAFIDWDDLRKQVPVFSRTILDEINKPVNKEKLKELAEQKMNEFAIATRDSLLDTTRIENLLREHHASTLNDFNIKSSYKISELQKLTYKYTFIMIASLMLILLLWIVVFRYPHLREPLFGISIILALITLLIALSSPMLEIDARIQELDIVLLGEHIGFHDQVIFFQSKSILDVVKILLNTKKPDSVFVGILILIFSVIFPITKLISTEVYLLGSEKIKGNRLVKFFAFHSGKWSMADVMVIAIFMAYVGFKGILDNQLKLLNYDTPSLNSIATNLTSLQPGFILFVAFVMFGLVLSEILKRISKKKKTPVATA